MSTLIRNVKTGLTLFVIALTFVASLGVPHMVMSMGMDTEGHMTHCPYMPGVSICTMTLLEMVAASQSFLNNIVLAQDSELIFLLLSTLIVLFALPASFTTPRVPIRFTVLKWKQRLPYSFLTEVFSQGILNPKLY